MLDSRTPSFFDRVEPVNFATFASPLIGIPRYDTFWSGVFRFLGARLLSRSGAQLYEHDRFLPSRFNPSSPEYSAHSASADNDASNERRSWFGKKKQKKRREQAEPLLKVLADPHFSFYRALAKFQRIEVFANAVNDRTVPFPTGAFELHDPVSPTIFLSLSPCVCVRERAHRLFFFPFSLKQFALARAKARKAAQDRGDDPDGDLDLKDGGLEL